MRSFHWFLSQNYGLLSISGTVRAQHWSISIPFIVFIGCFLNIVLVSSSFSHRMERDYPECSTTCSEKMRCNSLLRLTLIHLEGDGWIFCWFLNRNVKKISSKSRAPVEVTQSSPCSSVDSLSSRLLLVPFSVNWTPVYFYLSNPFLWMVVLYWNPFWSYTA